jgi:hypothetical protein
MSNSKNESHQNVPILEDAPVMRSMAISSTPAAHFLQFNDSSLPGPKHSPALIYNIPSKLEAKPSLPPSRWMPTRALPLPSYYRLERCHVYLGLDTTLPEISNRITEACRINSIAANFFDNDVSERLPCTPSLDPLFNSYLTVKSLLCHCNRRR